MSEHEREAAERARQQAEVERERRENLRRIGEGGPEQHVPGNVLAGRVEAERERVAAEEKRKDLRHFYVKLAGLIALPVAFVALLPAVVGLVYVNSVADENREVARTTKNALCDFKADLERRQQATLAIVNGIKSGERRPIPGITVADLDRSVANLQATVEALSDLECAP